MKQTLTTLLATCALVLHAHADGIPEPGIIYYGWITNSSGNVRLTNSSNTLVWKLQESSGSAAAIAMPITVSNSLQNLNNTYSYRLRVPFESVVGGNAASASAFTLRAADTTYANLSVSLVSGANSYPIFLSMANSNITHSAARRGQVKEVNLTVNAPAAAAFGGGGGQPPGRTNSLVSASGPNPSLQFIYVAPHPDGGFYLEWIGAPTNRNYFLLRSQGVATPAEQQEVVRQFQPSSEAVNFFWDTNVVNTTTYFYRLIAP